LTDEETFQIKLFAEHLIIPRKLFFNEQANNKISSDISDSKVFLELSSKYLFSLINLSPNPSECS